MEFIPDGYYSAGNFDRDLRPKVKAELIGRLASKREDDLVIAMGTWAGQDLATDQHPRLWWWLLPATRLAPILLPVRKTLGAIMSMLRSSQTAMQGR